MVETRKQEKIKACIAIAIIILVIIIAGIVSMKYSVEGEANMPFTLSKIMIVSTAEGVHNKGAQEKWNLAVFQNNDIYFSIEKSEKNKEEIIESISIENIQVIKNPNIGEVKTYMPNSLEGRVFSYEPEYILPENKLTFKGASKSNSKTLEIGNQGGTSIIRFSNVGIGSYISNDEEEIKHDGTLLKKANVELKDLSFEVNFDFIIQVKNKSYVSNISLTLPCGDNLLEEGTCSKEIKEGFIFKRITK